MLSALYAIAGPSVCLSITRVDHTKTWPQRMMQFSPHGSRLVFAGQVSSRNSKGFPASGGVKQGWGGKTSHFLTSNVNISKTVADTGKVTIND